MNLLLPMAHHIDTLRALRASLRPAAEDLLGAVDDLLRLSDSGDSEIEQRLAAAREGLDLAVDRAFADFDREGE